MAQTVLPRHLVPLVGTLFGAPVWPTAHTELIEHFRLQGHPRAWLRVFDENYRAVRFYERRGWHATLQTTRTSFAPSPVLRRYELDLYTV